MEPLTDVPVEYDDQGRIKYNPFYHTNQGKPWTMSDLEYLCKYSEVDELESMAMALGRTKNTVAEKLYQLRKNHRYELYRNLNRYW